MVSAVDRYAVAYLLYVFSGCSAIRSFATVSQENFAGREGNPDDGLGDSRQDDTEDKVLLYREMVDTAHKLCYMIKYGDEALEKYRADLSAYLTDPSASGTGKWEHMYRVSNYGLWGKYYDAANGWHRGIDICPGGNVHAICSGTVVYKTNYYFNVSNGDFTVTYMHLNQNEDIKEGSVIAAGQAIGTEGKISTDGHHTHVEFNPASYKRGTGVWTAGNGHVRPWSYDTSINLKSSNDIPLHSMASGQNMSLNPYPLIEQIWGGRMAGIPV